MLLGLPGVVDSFGDIFFMNNISSPTSQPFRALEIPKIQGSQHYVGVHEMTFWCQAAVTALLNTRNYLFNIFAYSVIQV